MVACELAHPAREAGGPVREEDLDLGETARVEQQLACGWVGVCVLRAEAEAEAKVELEAHRYPGRLAAPACLYEPALEREQSSQDGDRPGRRLLLEARLELEPSDSDLEHRADSLPCGTMGEPPMAKTLFDKIWESHVVAEPLGEPALLFVDLHLIHEVTSPQAFDGLRLAGRKLRRPDLSIATMDHNVPTEEGPITDPLAKAQLEALERNCAEFGVPLYATGSGREGIVHVIGPELGLTQPGMTIVCGDSHTSTHGAFGALAIGIGTSEVEHVLATQTLPQRKPASMRVRYEGELGFGVTAKDLILATIGQIGVDGGAGHVIEYAGPAIEALSMEGRLTVCNMTIEAGGRSGMIAPDDTTFEWVEGLEGAPDPLPLEEWRELRTNEGASF